MKSALARVPAEIEKLISGHREELNEAWERLGDSADVLTISFPVKIWVDKHGKNNCEVGIAFVKERIKSSTIFNWDDRQLSIFRPNLPTDLPDLDKEHPFYNGKKAGVAT